MFSRGLRVISRQAIAAPLARPALAARQLAPVASIEARRSYHEKVLDHYARPRNVGSMNKSDSDVGTGLVGAPACGDVMKLQIRVDPETQKISEVKFKTFGCGSAIASSSYLTELVRGMSLDDAGKVKNTEIAKELCLPPVKRMYRHLPPNGLQCALYFFANSMPIVHCSMLAEDAIKSAISDYYTKNPSRKPTDLSGTGMKMPTAEAVAA
ncbi:uncharacterized protein TRIVIDRAFT_179489 [Trichoderma virens Gv29-8]|uniref:NIF system FeS cluster assembly NifU N-terminal domain-containing protein n=1 Tax=Hypocrea virens (strain Gv29-8 / FGSC 10586) TaxID=413071 RepID=G9MQQ3_HYPVG|nr:uncharacterized protein TRIVIDRAFT_179489 [Trichoderma virens Gv29-8]EHK24120.1 hypothetical protein TRIVIDRAFT_179489 [Trichoderma virens Gv29-8]